ncbi:MAG: O-antigen ligase family protein [Parcubacteria group bacterium]|nr:O-antigen ligase family protein [Parcubacteria group bacterium]
MKLPTEKKLIQISVILIFLSLFLPSFRFKSQLFIPFKSLLFQFFVSLLFLIYFYLTLNNSKFRPKFSWLNLAVILFLISSLISLFFGVNPEKSFFGTLERMGGFLSLFYYGVLFFILSHLFKGEYQEKWRKFINWSLIAGFLAAFWGIGQWLKISFLFFEGERVSGPIGNPIFFAAYLLFMVFFSLLFFLESKTKQAKILYSSVLMISVFAIILSGSRAVSLSLILGLIFFSLFYAFLTQNKKIKKISVAVAIFIILIFGSILFFKNQPFIQNNFYLSRLALGSLKDFRNRYLAWQISWEAFKERPVFGWGEENFKIAFNKYFSPAYFDTPTAEVFFDRAHNVIFDRLTSIGIVGLLSYLFIFLAIYLTVFQLKKGKKINEGQFVIFLVLPAAYFLQNFFAFDTFPTYLKFFFFLAYLNSFVLGGEPKNKFEFFKKINFPSQYRLFIFIPVSFLIFFAIYKFNIKPLISIFYYVKSQNVQLLPEALKYYKKSVSFNTFANADIHDYFSRRFFQNVANDFIKTKEEKQKYLLMAEEAMRKAAILDPQNSDFWLKLAGIQIMLVENDIKEGLERAEISLKKVLELSPNNLPALLDLAEVKRLQDRPEIFLELAKKGVALNSKSSVAHWYLAAAYIANKNEIDAQKEFDIAYGSGYKEDIRDLRYLAGIYRKLNQWQKVAKFYEEIIKKDSTNADFYLRLAEAYYNLGKIDQAEKIFEKAKTINLDLEKIK